MTAKISDLGVARILNLTPQQVSRMTQAPGTPAYMPPEVMIANPTYDTSVDEFSYGILMIHVFSGMWPEPQVGQTHIEADQLIPVTEAERRDVFLRAIGNDNPLMDLILRCINNNPKHRAHASEIVERVTAMMLEFPVSFANRLEMLRHTEAQAEENQLKEQRILSLREEVQQKAEEIDRLNVVYCSEVEQLRLQIRDLNSQKHLLEARIEAKVKALQQEREHYGTHLAKENELSEKFANENHILQYEISKLRTDVNCLQHTNSTLKVDISRRDTAIKMKESEVEVKTRVLQEKDATISGMSEQLARVREHLVTKQQVSTELISCTYACICTPLL